MLDLTDVILTDGKVAECPLVFSGDHLAYRFGDFPVVGEKPGTLRIENTGSRKLALTGSLTLQVAIPCARCLEPVVSVLAIEPQMELDLNNNEYIDGYNLDVDQLIHDEALLVWPEQTLCRSDCKGLCMMCGQNLNLGSCTCEAAIPDPRMAKILDIFSNYKEV